MAIGELWNQSTQAVYLTFQDMIIRNDEEKIITYLFKSYSDFPYRKLLNENSAHAYYRISCMAVVWRECIYQGKHESKLIKKKSGQSVVFGTARPFAVFRFYQVFIFSLVLVAPQLEPFLPIARSIHRWSQCVSTSLLIMDIFEARRRKKNFPKNVFNHGNITKTDCKT